MALFALAMLLGLPPRGEDAAHRADRIRTEQLNRAAAATVGARDRSFAARAAEARRARADYDRQMAAWRDREAARRRYNSGLR